LTACRIGAPVTAIRISGRIEKYVHEQINGERIFSCPLSEPTLWAAVHEASIMPTWFSEQQLEKIPAFS
jgi:hypothetical protein